jgi:hypothetical protein
MKKNMKKIIFLTILTVGIYTYSNSKVLNQAKFYPTKETKVIRKTVKEYSHGVLQNEEIITYSYENNLVSRIVTTLANGDTIENVRVKFENGKLKQMYSESLPTINEKKMATTKIFNYTDDLITSIESNENAIKSLQLFYYNNLKQVEKEKIFRNENLDGEVNNEYSTSGNISKRAASSSRFNYINVYNSYDDKNNPFELIFPLAYLKIHVRAKNNVLSSRLGIANYTYKYEYNSNNYPVKITERVGTEKKITTIEYE